MDVLETWPSVVTGKDVLRDIRTWDVLGVTALEAQDVMWLLLHQSSAKSARLAINFELYKIIPKTSIKSYWNAAVEISKSKEKERNAVHVSLRSLS